MFKIIAKKVAKILLPLIIQEVEKLLQKDLDGDGKIG